MSKDKKRKNEIKKQDGFATDNDWSWVWLIVLLAFWGNNPISNKDDINE